MVLGYLHTLSCLFLFQLDLGLWHLLGWVVVLIVWHSWLRNLLVKMLAERLMMKIPLFVTFSLFTSMNFWLKLHLYGHQLEIVLLGHPHLHQMFSISPTMSQLKCKHHQLSNCCLWNVKHYMCYGSILIRLPPRSTSCWLLISVYPRQIIFKELLPSNTLLFFVRTRRGSLFLTVFRKGALIVHIFFLIFMKICKIFKDIS